LKQRNVSTNNTNTSRKRLLSVESFFDSRNTRDTSNVDGTTSSDGAINYSKDDSCAPRHLKENSMPLIKSSFSLLSTSKNNDGDGDIESDSDSNLADFDRNKNEPDSIDMAHSDHELELVSPSNKKRNVMQCNNMITKDDMKVKELKQKHDDNKKNYGNDANNNAGWKKLFGFWNTKNKNNDDEKQ